MTAAGVVYLIVMLVALALFIFYAKSGRLLKCVLFTAFTALLCFQLSHMRLCFMNMERAGLLKYENLVFILYCFGIVCGLSLAPLLLHRLRAAAFVRVWRDYGSKSVKLLG